jgi:adenylylsulfate kinase
VAASAASGAGALWIVGRPGSGKTTLGRRLVEALEARGRRATLVDSDEVRRAVTPTPTYGEAEREVFYRGLAYLAARLSAVGVVPVVAATAHRRAYRGWAREICPGLVLVYARCPLVVCEARDPKGLYARARRDPGNTLPGLGVAFEEPDDAEAVIDTDGPVGDDAVAAVLQLLGEAGASPGGSLSA